MIVLPADWLGGDRDVARRKAHEARERSRRDCTLTARLEDPSRGALVQGIRPNSPVGIHGDLFRLAAKAYRTRLAYGIDPLPPVHSALVHPVPHQILSVYVEIVPRQPLLFGLAENPDTAKIDSGVAA